MSTKTATIAPGIAIKDINPGDVFSETAHYKVDAVNAKTIAMTSVETGQQVQLSHQYVQDLLKTADQYTTEKSVTKEDGQSGSGIRSIFENIGTDVFTVCFTKQAKVRSQKSIREEKDAILKKATSILAAKKAGTAAKLLDLLNESLDNPISLEESGEDRVLRGYKIQHTSRDGKYDCIDMDLTKGSNIRPVNINTIKWLVVDGVKYTVK